MWKIGDQSIGKSLLGHRSNLDLVVGAEDINETEEFVIKNLLYKLVLDTPMLIEVINKVPWWLLRKRKDTIAVDWQTLHELLVGFSGSVNCS